MFRSTAARVSLIVIFALILGYYDLPNQYQTLPGTPEKVKQANVHLGLDLQGGSQLDYKIDLRKVPEQDRKQIVDGVLTVINRRVNSLGVSEPNIYTSQVGEEQHLIVELAGIKDLDEAKKIVGKTIQLEFKEQRTSEDPEYVKKIQENAQVTLKKVLAKPLEFSVMGQEENQAAPDKVFYEEKPWQFKSDLDKTILTPLSKLLLGKSIPKLIETTERGQKGFAIIRYDGSRETNSPGITDKQLKISHILVAYKDAERAPDSITRSKEEARALATELLAKLQKGGSFEAIAKESSNDPGSKEEGGRLAVPAGQESGYVDAFNQAALKLNKVSELSDVVESPFGFHIIRADDFSQIKYAQIFYSSQEDVWQDTGLTGAQFKRADVSFDNLLRPIVNIEFNEEGATLFEKITERNVNKPVAIFVGGNLISAPNVQQKITGGTAIITGQRTVQEAQDLARDLNTGAIPAPVVLTGQVTIGATLGQEALDASVRAGIIGLVLLVLFMIGYYRLPGFVAIIALSLYTGILVFLIKSELPMWMALIVAIGIFGAIVYKILQSKDGGWEKFISFILACFILYFVTFLLSNAVVLTLAGVAGVILSIGMAVDANILIFERMKEELRAGRPLSSAIDVGFDRAWSSIRDSNFSSLITCAILFYFGSSIIQGFAFNLAAGILVSMFTAITITKTLLTALMRTSLGTKMALWGLPKVAHEPKQYRIIEKTRVWFGISGTVLLVSIVALIFSGLKLSIDFKGGTLMDITFEKPVTVAQIKEQLGAVSGQLLENPKAAEESKPAGATLESAEENIDLAASKVVSGGENRYLISTEHIDNEMHEKILAQLQNSLGTLTENRFTTIGPVVGETLKRRAVIAVLLAMLAIVIYIAFAFRRIPKRMNPWKFGLCAIAALLHDVLIPIGVFSILQLEVDALFITAILTVLGFSVHDTIVVFDRIRENLKYQQRDETFAHLANRSMTQTMARSINTSLTTLITLVSLLVFGSSSISNFILVLVIGIFVGTYSSIFIASPLLVLWQNKGKE